MNHQFKLSPTEFEVQATAYTVLSKYYPLVRGELKIKPPFGRGARFDLLVFDDDMNLLFTIEVKDNPKTTEHSKKAYYEKVSGVPNYLIAGMDQARDAINVIIKQIKQG